MADMTIDEATADTTITGVEKVPASDGGAPKSVTTGQIRDFVLDALAASDAASSTSLSDDGIYVKQSGATKRLSGTTLAQAILNYACSLAGIVGPNGNEIFLIDDSGTKKSITLAQIAAYITANGADFFTSLSNAGTMAGTDGVMVKQGSAVKKGTLADLSAFTLGTFAAFVAAQSAVSTVEGTEKIAVVSGGVTKYVTLSQIVSEGDGVSTPSATTAGNIPTWGDSSGGSLGAGLSVGTSVRAQGTADNTTIPTEAAVRAAIGDGNVTGPNSTTENKIPQWTGTGKTLKDGLTLATTVATPGVDTKVPTEKAVRTAIAGAVNGLGAGDVTGPTTTTENNVPQWDSTQKKLKNGLGVVTSVGGTGANTNIPTEKAVRDAITDAVSTAVGAEATERDAAIEEAVEDEASARDAAIAAAVNGLGAGDVKGPSTTTSGKIPQWDSTQKKLTDGLGLVSTVGGTGLDTNVPTEKAVRTAITGATADAIMKSGTPTSGNLAKFNGGNTVTNGPEVATSVGFTGTDTAVPTEKAVRSAITAAVSAALETAAADATSKANAAQSAASAAVAEKVSAPVSHTENKIPTWGASNELKDGKSVVTTLASTGSNDNIPTEKAVRDALPVAATTAADGLMTAADKAKLDGLVDTSAVSEIGNESPLADSDVVTVLKGGTTWMKALMTRFWTYIMGKLATFKIDDLAAGDDNTDLDASTARHGLCPKFPNDSTKFLRGDGSFAVPNGSTAFTGDSGDGGASGLVPAPASGDAAANKFLNADGSWAVPPSAAGVDIPGSTAIDAAAAADTLICYDASENGYRKMTLAQVTALVLGTKRYDTIFISAGAMMPGANNPATAGTVTFTNAKHDTLAFNATADQTAEFDIVLPDGWDMGAVKAKFLWTASDSTKAEQGEMVAWQIGGVAIPDEGAVTLAPSAWVAKTDTLSQVNELHKTAATAALTLEGTVGEGNLLHFVVRRNNTTSELSTPLDTEALLLGVVLQYGKTEDSEQW